MYIYIIISPSLLKIVLLLVHFCSSKHLILPRLSDMFIFPFILKTIKRSVLFKYIYYLVDWCIYIQYSIFLIFSDFLKTHYFHPFISQLKNCQLFYPWNIYIPPADDNHGKMVVYPLCSPVYDLIHLYANVVPGLLNSIKEMKPTYFINFVYPPLNYCLMHLQLFGHGHLLII